METAKIERINELYRKSKAEGLTEEEKTPSESIKAAVAYFAMLLQKADTLGCDLDAVIQAYNYGAEYIDYITDRRKAHTFQY